jgi:hypothetical protein
MMHMSMRAHVSANAKTKEPHGMLGLALDRECVVTFEQTRDALEAVERRLADRLGIHAAHGHIRRELLKLDRAGQLDEDELVADWYDLFASYLDWTRDESWHGPPEVVPPPEKEERAAESGPSAFV